MQCAARSAPQSRRRPRARGEDQFRADAVGRGGEQLLGVEWVQPREGAEPGRARRFDGGAQAFDDRVGRRQRDSRRFVAVLGAPQSEESTTACGRSKWQPSSFPTAWSPCRFSPPGASNRSRPCPRSWLRWSTCGGRARSPVEASRCHACGRRASGRELRWLCSRSTRPSTISARSTSSSCTCSSTSSSATSHRSRSSSG